MSLAKSLAESVSRPGNIRLTLPLSPQPAPVSRRATQAGVPVRVRPAGPMTLDNGRTWLYHSCMNSAIASGLVQAAHRVESRLEEALAGVGLSIAKFETLSVLVSQDRPISLSELAAKLVCVKSNVTQLFDRLETERLLKRANDPADRVPVRAEVTALGRKRQAAGTPVVNAGLQDVANKLAAVDSQKLKRALDAIQREFFCSSGSCMHYSSLNYSL